MSPRFPPDSPTLNACQLVPAVGSHQFLDIFSHVLGGSLKIHLSKKGAYCSWRELFPSPPGIIYVYKLFNVILFDFWPWKQGDQLLPMEWPFDLCDQHFGQTNKYPTSVTRIFGRKPMTPSIKFIPFKSWVWLYMYFTSHSKIIGGKKLDSNYSSNQQVNVKHLDIP